MPMRFSPPESPGPLPESRLCAVFGPEADGRRLDDALGGLLPGWGLRARRRLWEGCRILLNDRPRPPGWRVRSGDRLRVEPLHLAPGAGFSADPYSVPSIEFPLPRGLSLVSVRFPFAAFAKPAGLHTAHIRGKIALVEGLEAAPTGKQDSEATGGGPGSLEALLRLPAVRRRLWEEYQEKHSAEPPAGLAPAAWAFMESSEMSSGLLLLTRLDQPTSGLVLAALKEGAAARFRVEEQAGRVRKIYAAVVQGRLERPLRLENALRTDNRAKTRVLAEPDSDEARHTLAEPLGPFGEGLTLVRVRIRRGARHQIRAHLAHAGFPLLGETVYGSPGGASRLFLHHAAVSFEGFAAACPPEWLSSGQWARLEQINFEVI